MPMTAQRSIDMAMHSVSAAERKSKAISISFSVVTLCVSFLVAATSFALLSAAVFESESARKAIALIGTLGFLLIAASAYSFAAFSWNAYWRERCQRVLVEGELREAEEQIPQLVSRIVRDIAAREGPGNAMPIEVQRNFAALVAQQVTPEVVQKAQASIHEYAARVG